MARYKIENDRWVRTNKRRRIDHASILAVIVLVAALAASTIFTFVGWKDCSDRGGEWVRGAFWFTCVDEDD